MKPFIRIVSLSLILASPFGGARVIPDGTQKPAPGNEAQQTPLNRANYSPSVNYKLQCLGCHLNAGQGSPDNDIPQMKGFVGNFLKVKGGREFLVQVPGVSQAALDNQQLAELMNWMLRDNGIAGGSSPADFRLYTAEEVKTYRDRTVKDLPKRREKLIKRIQNQGIEIPEGVIR